MKLKYEQIENTAAGEWRARGAKVSTGLKGRNVQKDHCHSPRAGGDDTSSSRSNRVVARWRYKKERVRAARIRIQ